MALNRGHNSTRRPPERRERSKFAAGEGKNDILDGRGGAVQRKPERSWGKVVLQMGSLAEGRSGKKKSKIYTAQKMKKEKKRRKIKIEKKKE